MANKTLMGWNQVVWLTDSRVALKVSEFTLGVKQTYNVPELVTGLTDAITWSKGNVEVTGRLSAPITKSFSTDLLAKGLMDPTGNLTEVNLSSTVSAPIEGKINTIDLSASAGEAITATVEIFGRLTDAVGALYKSTWDALDSDNQYLQIFDDPTPTSEAPTENLVLEQVPMFDRVTNAQTFLPQPYSGTQSQCQVTKLDLKIENNLKRNYVLGTESLNCYSISAGLRKITGTVTYISGGSGELTYITAAGRTGGVIGDVAFGPINFALGDQATVVFEATPPQLRPGDVVSLSSSFQVLALNYGIIQISII